MLKVIWSNLINLDEGNIDKGVDNKAGIYRLSVKFKDGKYNIFYVGSANDLNRRLKEHLSDNEENRCIRDNVKNYIMAFRFAYIPEKNIREGAERFMYDHYKPSCNEIEPPSSPVEINID